MFGQGQGLEQGIILGIDPGTAITGYGIIETHRPHYKIIDYGCIRPPAQTKPEAKYLILFNAIEELIKTYHPNALAVESQFVYKNPQSALKLGMAKAMAVLAAARNNIPLFEYAPSQAKLAVVGKGSASKEQVQKMLQLLFNIPHPPSPEDAADALAIAICHAHTLSLVGRK